MLRVAAQYDPGAVVAYVCGIAEAIPLRDRSCAMAWMSQVLHHVRDRPACARELRRILVPGGRVLVRGTFADQLNGFPALFHFFPGARQVCEGFPTTVETTGVFEAAGFAIEAHRKIEQSTCGSLREFVERTRRRADTSLALLSDREFHVGLAALEGAAAEEIEPTPVRETLDLLIFAIRTDVRGA
jgi:SAM-dependent methyltransferase